MTVTPIAIFGAGSIGCFVGGILLNAGIDVRFIGRENTGNRITGSGMVLSSIDHESVHIEGQNIVWSTTPAMLTECKTILLCTKSADTLASANLIRKHCDNDVVVISLQNGVGNVKILRDTLAKITVLQAMVSFNVARIAQTPLRFHRGTDGEIIFQQHQATKHLSNILTANNVKSWCVEDMGPISWGKLLMNLNNAVNVISNLPLKRQLQTHAYRRILAASVQEALEVMKVSGIKPAKVGKVPPALMPVILRLPDLVFSLVARSMLKIDDQARSSMWEDLQAGRKSEIDFLNGAICELGRSNNLPTPVNDVMVQLVRAQFSGNPTRQMSSGEILNKINAAKSRSN